MVWRVFQELERLRDEMNGLLSSDWRPQFGSIARTGPLLNLYETPEDYVVVAEIPGADRKKLDVSITAGTLSLKGEYKPRTEEAEWVREERAKGEFHRVVSLTGEIDPNKVDATYKDGILTVHVAKAEAARPKQIQVKVS